MNPRSPSFMKNSSFMINDILRNQSQERLQDNEILKASSSSNPFFLFGRNNCTATDMFLSNHIRSGIPPVPGSSAFRLQNCIDDFNPYLKGPLNFVNTRYLPRASSDLISANCMFPPLLAASAMNHYLPFYLKNRLLSFPDAGSNGTRKCRRSRTVFSELQLMALEGRFKQQKYLSTPDRMELAEGLGLTQLQVKTWYQNRRMKWKKQIQEKDEANTTPCDSSGSNTSSQQSSRLKPRSEHDDEIGWESTQEGSFGKQSCTESITPGAFQNKHCLSSSEKYCMVSEASISTEVSERTVKN